MSLLPDLQPLAEASEKMTDPKDTATAAAAETKPAEEEAPKPRMPPPRGASLQRMGGSKKLLEGL